LGRFAKAEPLFQRSLKIRETKLGKDHPDVASSLNTLALLQVDQQHLTEPASLADRSRHIIRIHVARTLPLLSEKEQLTFLEKTDEKRFHAWQSFSLIRRGDAALAALSAAWVVNGKAVAHEALAERALLVREQKNPAAAELAQQLLQVRRQLAALSLASPKPSQEEGHRQYLARLNEQEQDLSRRLGQASGRASRDDPWVNPDEIRKKLPANTVLVELSRFRIYNFQRKTNEKWWQPGHYAAWVIPPAGQGNVSLIDLGEADQIEKAVQVVQQALKDSPQGIAKAGEPDSEKTLQQSLQNLSRLVLQPLLPHLEKKYCWLLSPDAALWLVPWAALPLPDGKYSLEKHQISYLVSGRDLVRPVAKVKPTRPMVLADPDFDLGLADARKAAQELLVNPQPLLEFRGLAPSLKLPPVPRLKGTATEAKAIQPTLARYAGQKPWIFLEEQALEGVFKALASPQVLVLSTHGFFLPKQEVEVSEGAGLEEKGPVLDKEGKLLENPLLRCGLLLAGCNQREALGEQDEDGVLTGLEIVGTDLRGTELVVLSACETGLGDVRTGEGVAGLRQAFQLAGASAVVATLWSIPDRESARLMSDFFGNLAKGQSKAAALREAQLMRIKAHRERSGAAHPFFWAAFTLTGR
jgi:CHAT domain-containing protein